jgi:hypothetical protein
MVSLLGEKQQNLHGSVFDGRSQVLDGHQRERHGAERRSGITTRARRVPDFEAGDRRAPDESPLDPLGPLGRVRALPESDQGRPVDQPGRLGSGCSSWSPPRYLMTSEPERLPTPRSSVRRPSRLSGMARRVLEDVELFSPPRVERVHLAGRASLRGHLRD